MYHIPNIGPIWLVSSLYVVNHCNPREGGDSPCDPPGLETLSEDLRNDRDIVLAAVPGWFHYMIIYTLGSVSVGAGIDSVRFLRFGKHLVFPQKS